MFKALVDRSVWLDLAKDARHEKLLTALETMVAGNYVKLIVPRTVIEEFERNKARIVEDSRKSFTTVLKRMKGAAETVKDLAKRKQFLDQLQEIDHALPRQSDTITKTIGRIETLFKTATVVERGDGVLARAAKRGVEKKAPFHRAKNSIEDAILIETFADLVTAEKKDTRCAFVTHNVNDFSLTKGDERKPHVDIAGLFDEKRSLYFINLGDALKTAEPDVLEEFEFEHEFQQEPRSLAEILDAIDLLFDQVWYNRHKILEEKIATGTHRLADPPPGKMSFDPNTTMPSVWKLAREGARRVEERRASENLGPWDDFDWGMINGKLSALRWVLGDEWDILDT